MYISIMPIFVSLCLITVLVDNKITGLVRKQKEKKQQDK